MRRALGLRIEPYAKDQACRGDGGDFDEIAAADFDDHGYTSRPVSS